MTLRLSWWCLACCAGVLAGPLGAAPTRLVQPFVQPIGLTDFQLLETDNDLALSPSHELVLCFTYASQPRAINRVVTLRSRSRNGYVLSYLLARPAGEAGRFQRQELELAPEIARNVLACFRDLMEHSLLSSPPAMHVASDNDDAWIFLRPPGNRTTTGVALNGVLQTAGDYENVIIYRDLCAGLVGVFAYPEERNALLKQLDRLAAVYVKTNGLAPR